VDFHVVSKQSFKLSQNIDWCFFPVTFDELHFTRTRVFVHSSIVSFRLAGNSEEESKYSSSDLTIMEFTKESMLGLSPGKSKTAIEETDIKEIYDSIICHIVKVREELNSRYKRLKHFKGTRKKVNITL